MATHYRHTQLGWVTVASLAAVLAFVFALPGLRPPLGLLIGVGGLLLVSLLIFATLTVEVDDREIRVRFTLGLVRRRVPLADLAGHRVVRNPWWYGWGIHAIPDGWIWNVSGLDAVELQLRSGRVLRVGTDEPAALARAIGQVAPQAAAGEGQAPAHRSARWPAFLVGAVVLLGLGSLAMTLHLQTRPPRVSVSDDRISVESLFYGQDYPLAEVTSVSLESRLPRILARTNGFAGGGSLRGWFRLQDLGEGKLFVEVGRPPYVLVRLRQGFFAVGFEDPRKTQSLYDEIRFQAAPQLQD